MYAYALSTQQGTTYTPGKIAEMNINVSSGNSIVAPESDREPAAENTPIQDSNDRDSHSRKLDKPHVAFSHISRYFNGWSSSPFPSSAWVEANVEV